MIKNGIIFVYVDESWWILAGCSVADGGVWVEDALMSFRMYVEKYRNALTHL